MFPSDFNGIIAGSAVAYWSHIIAEQLNSSLILLNAGIQGTPGANILKLAAQATTAACTGDAAHGGDGAEDGLLANPRLCHWNPQALVCTQGQNPNTCITQSQANALKADESPLRDNVTGNWLFPGYEPLTEADLITRWDVSISGPGRAYYEIVLNNPNWIPTTFNVHTDLPLSVNGTMGVVDTMTDPDLSAFKRAGGKLIQLHGWSDGATMPSWITHYYDEVVRDVGRGRLEGVQDFYRLFMIPNAGHCEDNPATNIGPANVGEENFTAVSPDAEHDVVTAVLDWAEKGIAPKKLIATRFNNNDPSQGIQMQRPLCPYPAVAIYNGQGNTTEAASFHCEHDADDHHADNDHHDHDREHGDDH